MDGDPALLADRSWMFDPCSRENKSFWWTVVDAISVAAPPSSLWSLSLMFVSEAGSFSVGSDGLFIQSR